MTGWPIGVLPIGVLPAGVLPAGVLTIVTPLRGGAYWTLVSLPLCVIVSAAKQSSHIDCFGRFSLAMTQSVSKTC